MPSAKKTRQPRAVFCLSCILFVCNTKRVNAQTGSIWNFIGNVATCEGRNNCQQAISDCQDQGYAVDMAPDNSIYCISCIKGMTMNKQPASGGQSNWNCEDCPAGTYRISAESHNDCQNCPVNTDSPPRSHSTGACVEECAIGNTLSESGECVECIAGKYKASIGNHECDSCNAGTFSTDVGATSVSLCRQCPEHTNSIEGSDEQIDCKCIPGTSGDNGGPTCTPCGMGQYQPDLGRSRCYPCAPDTYLNITGQKDSKDCLKCPDKTSSVIQSTSESQCICDPGTSGANGGPFCHHCEEGKYQERTNSETCEMCREGTYLNTTGMKSSDDCNLCELGRYQHERGKSHCNLCASGTYLNITGGSAASDCISCPSNAGNSTPGSIDMTDCKCNPGTSGVDGGPICNLCEIGKFTDVSGVSICSPTTTVCPPGQYADSLNTCTSCPMSYNATFLTTAYSTGTSIVGCIQLLMT